MKPLAKHIISICFQPTIILSTLKTKPYDYK
jgi:hypothetical protein